MNAAAFDAYKRDLLSKLDAGVDFSPKGSIDYPVVELVNFLNTIPGYVTTSSCAGRISVFLNENNTKGIRWIFVKHRTVRVEEAMKAITAVEDSSMDLVMLKCEAFILHVACKDIECGRALFQLAMSCGFRESGISIGQKRVLVAVRSTAFCLELPIARGNKLLVSEDYMNLIFNEANTKLRNNFARTDRFFLELKKLFQFPTLSVKIIPNTDTKAVARWGHTCVPVDTDGVVSTVAQLPEAVIVGGYGVEDVKTVGSGSEKCVRGLTSLVYSNNSLKSNGSPNHSMHSAGVHVSLPLDGITYDLVVVSGGRASPQSALPAIQFVTLAQNSAVLVKHTENGSIPAARWGHSLTTISADSCLLYGGRDDSVLYSDCYVVQFSMVSASEVHCVWRQLNLSVLSTSSSFMDNVTDASVALPVARCFHAATIVNDVYVEYGQSRNYVLIHGGLLSLEDPITSSEVFIVNPWNSSVQIVHSNRFVASVDASDSSEVSEGVAAKPQKAVDTGVVTSVKRFAHTLTKIGGKSILLLGGVNSDLSGSSQSAASTENETVCMDLVMDGKGRYCVDYRTVNSQVLSNNADKESVTLPCQECRSHHTVHYNKLKRVLSVQGGGLHALAFGPHLCCSLDIKVSCGYDITLSSNITKTKKVEGKKCKKDSMYNSKRQENVAMNELSSTDTTKDVKVTAVIPPSVKSTDSDVLVCPAGQVKSLKVYLESIKMFNKALNISQINSAVTLQDVRAFQLVDGCVGELKNEECLAVYSEYVKLSAVAIPVFSQLVETLAQNGSELLKIVDILKCHNVIVATLQNTKGSKRALANTFQLANDLLTDIAHRYQLPTGPQLPNNFEIVGNFLMIPDNALCGVEWESFLYEDKTRTLQLWTSLASIFGLHKVARKSIIDSGVLRESRVQLLLPDVGTPVETGPNTVGWNTVLENKISYSFDITRVMFCSGNITEKIRMANVKNAKNQIVVDFYCGIGYYTIPLLVHAKVAHVYACEWNPNSVLALRENMKANKVDPSQYTILQGNNQETSVSLVDVADRILLGLLPSSTAGWPLAARALKPSGGIIHVHENVLDAELESWCEATCEKFKQLLAEYGKPLSVEKIHLEKVKSYAPHIYHVVLDLNCHL